MGISGFVWGLDSQDECDFGGFAQTTSLEPRQTCRPLGGRERGDGGGETGGSGDRARSPTPRSSRATRPSAPCFGRFTACSRQPYPPNPPSFPRLHRPVYPSHPLHLPPCPDLKPPTKWPERCVVHGLAMATCLTPRVMIASTPVPTLVLAPLFPTCALAPRAPAQAVPASQKGSWTSFLKSYVPPHPSPRRPADEPNLARSTCLSASRLLPSSQDRVLLWGPLLPDRPAVHPFPHLPHRVPWYAPPAACSHSRGITVLTRPDSLLVRTPSAVLCHRRCDDGAGEVNRGPEVVHRESGPRA